MNAPSYVALVLVLVIAIGASVSFNRFVAQRNAIANSWSNVDSELRRRYDLVPNLVETVAGYAAHERATLEQVVRARSAAVAEAGGVAPQEAAENVFVSALRRMLALAESYPGLRASDHFLALQRQLVDTEDRIQAARRLYNANVRDYNSRVEAFPSMLIARIGGFVRADYFEVDPVVRAPVAVDYR